MSPPMPPAEYARYAQHREVMGHLNSAFHELSDARANGDKWRDQAHHNRFNNALRLARSTAPSPELQAHIDQLISNHVHTTTIGANEPVRNIDSFDANFNAAHGAVQAGITAFEEAQEAMNAPEAGAAAHVPVQQHPQHPLDVAVLRDAGMNPAQIGMMVRDATSRGQPVINSAAAGGREERPPGWGHELGRNIAESMGAPLGMGLGGATATFATGIVYLILGIVIVFVVTRVFGIL